MAIKAAMAKVVPIAWKAVAIVSNSSKEIGSEKLKNVLLVLFSAAHVITWADLLIKPNPIETLGEDKNENLQK